MASYGSVSGKAVIGSTLLVPNVSYKDTPVTITSWSYVTTTITLNVASHTFVAGDYIEVGGLTATTNIPNGVHLVTSVTTTTIVFTYALTPTGTAGVSSATVKGYMTTNGRVEGLGIGQTRQNVTGSRVAGTTYTNSSGKPRLVSINVSGINDAIITMTINGIASTVTQSSRDNTGNTMAANVTMPIMNGETYSVAVTGTISTWWEIV